MPPPITATSTLRSELSEGKEEEVPEVFHTESVVINPVLMGIVFSVRQAIHRILIDPGPAIMTYKNYAFNGETGTLTGLLLYIPRLPFEDASTPCRDIVET
jgi:hypothetical protein